MPAKFVLGLNTLQMNKDHDYGGGRVANQLRTLEHLGVFKKPLPKPPEELPRLVNHADPAQPLEARARAYLHANCAHCHMKWGGGNAEFELTATLDLPETRTLSVKPQHGKFDLNDPALLVPGAPERSLLLYRMKQVNAAHAAGGVGSGGRGWRAGGGGVDQGDAVRPMRLTPAGAATAFAEMDLMTMRPAPHCPAERRKTLSHRRDKAVDNSALDGTAFLCKLLCKSLTPPLLRRLSTRPVGSSSS